MTVLEFARTDARADLAMLAGTWRNTNERSTGITSIRMRDDGGVLALNVIGSADWGTTAASVYHERNDEGLEQPFTASYDLGFMDVTLQGFLRQGVLVILSFTRFTDASGRANYFSKEFFHRVAD